LKVQCGVYFLQIEPSISQADRAAKKLKMKKIFI